MSVNFGSLLKLVSQVIDSLTKRALGHKIKLGFYLLGPGSVKRLSNFRTLEHTPGQKVHPLAECLIGPG